MATYQNETSNIVHSAGKGGRTLCGIENTLMKLRRTNRGATCLRCKAVKRR